ncbi:MAG: hypothetical protein PUC76_05855 [Clostridia bacterium]|nr:hypothetical protein [Clostridia bacterium]
MIPPGGSAPCALASLPKKGSEGCHDIEYFRPVRYLSANGAERYSTG